MRLSFRGAVSRIFPMHRSFLGEGGGYPRLQHGQRVPLGQAEQSGSKSLNLSFGERKTAEWPLMQRSGRFPHSLNGYLPSGRMPRGIATGDRE